MAPEWIIALVGIGSVLGLSVIILLSLANHGFKTIIKTLDQQGRDIKLIGESLGKCVTWADLERELGPIRSDLRGYGKSITEITTRCGEHHK